ncbi:hypothetical protein GN956_G7699 [Arapaima gigas]
MAIPRRSYGSVTTRNVTQAPLLGCVLGHITTDKGSWDRLTTWWRNYISHLATEYQRIQLEEFQVTLTHVFIPFIQN